MIGIAKNFKTYVSLGNLGLSLGEIHCSPKQLKLLLPKNMIVPQGKTNFPWGTYVLKFLAILVISYLFLYKVVTYHDAPPSSLIDSIANPR